MGRREGARSGKSENVCGEARRPVSGGLPWQVQDKGAKRCSGHLPRGRSGGQAGRGAKEGRCRTQTLPSKSGLLLFLLPQPIPKAKPELETSASRARRH